MLPVVVAHTVLVSGEDEDEKDVKIGGALGNLMHATNTAMEAAIRKLHVGSTNSEVTRVINAVADAFGVKPVQGVLSHNMARFVIDGEKVIISTTDAETKVDEVKFEELEVWTLDIIMSSGDGKPREVDDKPTIFKRSVDVRYQRKMKGEREVYSPNGLEVDGIKAISGRCLRRSPLQSGGPTSMSTWYGGDPNKPKDAEEFHFLRGRDGSVSRRQ
jgi:methionine aminopeptidase